MRMLVTGREGQVARSLAERAPGEGFELVTLGRPEFDLAANAPDIRSAIEAARPDVIVSAAAYTQVDKAESEPELAYAVNADGTLAIVQAATSLDVPLIHLSTDYVFDGGRSTPYAEDDATGPTGVYGASKLAGEQAVLAGYADSVILRTAWVYSPFGANFVKTMLRLAGDRNEVSVVADQIGNPTSALDIATGVLAVARNLLREKDARLRGVFHMTAAGSATWADLAEAIFEESARLGGPAAMVRRITSADYPTPAKRPTNSRLDCIRLAEVHGVRLPEWRASLKGVVERLVVGNGER